MRTEDRVPARNDPEPGAERDCRAGTNGTRLSESLCYLLALGSNLGDRAERLRRSRAALERRGVRVLQQSRVYESAAWGDPGGPPFFNAVLELACPLGPFALLAELKDLEAELGREPGLPRNAPRPIDLDLIAAERVRMTTRALTLPHPRLWRREFVLRPLEDLRTIGRYFPFGLPERGLSSVEPTAVAGW